MALHHRQQLASFVLDVFAAASSGDRWRGEDAASAAPTFRRSYSSSFSPDDTIDAEDFDWHSILDAADAAAVPDHAFEHLDRSVRSALRKGMILESRVKHPQHFAVDAVADASEIYWLAEIVISCGPMVMLKYLGMESVVEDLEFWEVLRDGNLHPIGWCAENAKCLVPPLAAASSKAASWQAAVEDRVNSSPHAPAFALSGTDGAAPADVIAPGMLVECRDPFGRPDAVWLARVGANVGGRLRLRFVRVEKKEEREEEGEDDDEKKDEDFWLFYSSPFLHPVGWAATHGADFRPPPRFVAPGDSFEDWATALAAALSAPDAAPVPNEVFADQDPLYIQCFEVGAKLEAIDPECHAKIGPATVVGVVDDRFCFLRMDVVDDSPLPAPFLCYANLTNAFPIDFCSSNGLLLTPPRGWGSKPFDWRQYLEATDSAPAPRWMFPQNILIDHNTSGELESHFSENEKLEVAHPPYSDSIWPATVKRVVGPMLWLHLDATSEAETEASTGERHHLVVDSRSLDLYSVGWCQVNHHPILRPHGLKEMVEAMEMKAAPFVDAICNSVAIYKEEILTERKEEVKVMTEPSFGNQEEELENAKPGRSSHCPLIYFNHKCYCGPYLSKNRIAELPRAVGPGNVSLVLNDVLSKLVNVGYKPAKVLKELQLEADEDDDHDMEKQVLKARICRGRSYRGSVEIPRFADRVEDFCREVCRRLDSCCNLISPHHYNGQPCPENCDSVKRPVKPATVFRGGRKRRKRGAGAANSTANSAANANSADSKASKAEDENHGADDAAADETAGVEPSKDGGEGEHTPETTNKRRGRPKRKEAKQEATSPDLPTEKTLRSSSTKSGGKKRGLDSFIEDVRSPKNAEEETKKRKYSFSVPPPTEIRTRASLGKGPRYTFDKKTHEKSFLPPSPPDLSTFSTSMKGKSTRGRLAASAAPSSSPPVSRGASPIPNGAKPVVHKPSTRSAGKLAQSEEVVAKAEADSKHEADSKPEDDASKLPVDEARSTTPPPEVTSSGRVTRGARRKEFLRLTPSPEPKKPSRRGGWRGRGKRKTEKEEEEKEAKRTKTEETVSASSSSSSSATLDESVETVEDEKAETAKEDEDEDDGKTKSGEVDVETRNDDDDDNDGDSQGDDEDDNQDAKSNSGRENKDLKSTTSVATPPPSSPTPPPTSPTPPPTSSSPTTPIEPESPVAGTESAPTQAIDGPTTSSSPASAASSPIPSTSAAVPPSGAEIVSAKEEVLGDGDGIDAVVSTKSEPVVKEEESCTTKEEEEEAASTSDSKDVGSEITSNPLYWTTEEMAAFISRTECGYLSPIFLEEQIDGQAFMLLNLPTVQQFLNLKMTAAIALCHIIERVKLVFIMRYCSEDDDDDEEDDDDDEDGDAGGSEFAASDSVGEDVVVVDDEAADAGNAAPAPAISV